MRRLWIILLALLLVGCDDGLYSGTLVFDGVHTIGPETHLPGDVLLRAGTVELTAGSKVDGSVYVLGGALLVDGEIGGDLAVLGGRVALGPQAVVGGDLRMGAGTMTSAESAAIHGEIITGLALPLDSKPQATRWDAAARWLVGALLLAALGGLWAQRRPQPLHNIADAATAHWPAAAALGLLALLVLPVLLVMMAFTIVLIPLVMVLGLAIFLVLGMGIISLGGLLGQWLAARLSRPWSRGWTTFGGTLLLMGLYGLPVVGDLLAGVTAVLLFGAVLLSRFGMQDYEPPPTVTMVEDLATYKRPL
ncbi:MAG: polymer-forming cytoskeletal protein [Chloroflexota bacterium]